MQQLEKKQLPRYAAKVTKTDLASVVVIKQLESFQHLFDWVPLQHTLSRWSISLKLQSLFISLTDFVEVSLGDEAVSLTVIILENLLNFNFLHIKAKSAQRNL